MADVFIFFMATTKALNRHFMLYEMVFSCQLGGQRLTFSHQAIWLINAEREGEELDYRDNPASKNTRVYNLYGRELLLPAGRAIP